MTEENRVVITFREIYNQMQEVTVELRLLRQEYANDKTIKDDHEKRIRGLEAWKYGLPAALIAGVVGIILNFTMKG
jgi:hypothetical protein